MINTAAKLNFPLILPQRRLITICGKDAADFLNAIITADMSTLQLKQLKPAALLSPQGKILFDFLIARLAANSTEDAFQIDIAADLAEGFSRRLGFYKLRSQIEIGVSNPCTAIIAPDEIAHSWQDVRFPDSYPVWRSYNTAVSEESEITGQAEWDKLRINFCLPEGGHDFPLGDSFPHDVNYDALGAVIRQKGCYIGQEIVSRMQHKAIIRKRLVKVKAEQSLPPQGTNITLDGKIIGQLGTVSGKQALAVIRLDKALAGKTPAQAGTALLHFIAPPYLPELLTMSQVTAKHIKDK